MCILYSFNVQEQVQVSTRSVEGCAEPQQCFEVPVR